MKPSRVAVTGGIGSGKSEACRYLRSRGYTVVDCDEIARELANDPEILAEISEAFGEGFVKDGKLQRRELGRHVFASRSLTERLNGIFYGRIAEELEKQLSEGKGKAVFAEVPQLFESGMDKDFDEIWLIEAGEEERIKRVAARDKMQEEEILLRIKRQNACGEGDKVKIINNDGEITSLYKQIDCLLLQFP